MPTPAKFLFLFLTVYVLTLSYATCSPCFSRLRAELAVLRRRGAVRVGGDAPADPGRACGRCRAELGRIINRGAVCRSASFFSSHIHQFLPQCRVRRFFMGSVMSSFVIFCNNVSVRYLVKNKLYKGVEMSVYL
jgi:hypothetical protein